MAARKPPASKLLTSGGGTGALSDETEAWRKKQLEIRELQEASKSLLRRVQAPPAQGKPLLEPPPPWPLPTNSVPATASAPSSAAPSAVGATLAVATLPTSASPMGALRPGRPVLTAAHSPDQTLDEATLVAVPTPSAAAVGGPERRSVSLLEEHGKLADEAAGLRGEVLELRRTAAERDREIRSLREQTQKLSEALAETEKHSKELADENETLQKAKHLIERLNDGGVTHKFVRSYIENDLATMRDERRNAEALLRAEAKKWEEKADKLVLEHEEAVERQEQSESRFEAAQADHHAHRRATEAVAAAADEDRQQRVAAAQLQTSHAEVAVRDLRRRVEVCTEELAQEAARLQGTEASAHAHSTECDELRARFDELEHVRREQEAIAASELSDLARRLHSHEAEAAAEARRLRESLEQQRTSAAEATKKFKREANKKASELQTRCNELEKEAEDLATKAKEAERNLLTKLSNARQDRQRAEGKLRSQLQVVSEEWRVERDTGEESQAIIERWSEAMEELAQLREESASSEAECSALRQRLEKTSRALRQENEALSKKVEGVGGEAKQEFQAELLQERERWREEAWERLSATQAQHVSQIAQIQESKEREAQKLQVAVNEAKADLERQMKEEEARAAQRAKELRSRLSMEEREVSDHANELNELREAREELVEELAVARADAEGALQQHEALLEQLRKEHEAAETQFQQVMLQAQDKQRRLGKLQDSAPAEESVDVAASPFAPTVSTVAASWSSGLFAAGGATSSRPAGFGGTAGAATPRSMASPRSPCSTQGLAAWGGGAPSDVDVAPPEDGGVDTVLRALTRERAARKAHRAHDELLGLIGRAERELREGGGSRSRGRDDDEHEVLPKGWAGVAQRLLDELMQLLEQTALVAAEDEQRLMQCHDLEVQLRAQIVQAHSLAKLRKSEVLRRAEIGCELCEAEAGRIQSLLDEAREENLRGEETIELVELNFHRKAFIKAEASVGEELRASMAHEVREDEEARAQLESIAAAGMNRLEEETAEDREAFRSELLELRKALQRELTATRDEHGGLARREARLESRLERLRLDYEEAAGELRDERQAMKEAMQEFEAERKHEWLDRRRERQHVREAHEDECEILMREIGQFQEEQLSLEGQLSELGDHHLPECEAELSETRVRYEESQAALWDEPERRRVERRTMIQQLRVLEEEEGIAEQFRLEIEEHLEGQLARSEQAEAKAKEQLHTAREERMRDRQRNDKQVERLRTRVQALEQAESALEKKCEWAEKHRANVERGGGRSLQESAQQLERARQENRQVVAALDEARTRERAASEDLHEVRMVVHAVEERLLTAENRCRDLEGERYTALMSESTWHSEHQLVETKLASRYEAAAAAESWGQELSRKLQNVESRAMRDSQERTQQEAEMFQSRLANAAAEAEEARRDSSNAHRALERLRRIVEQESLRLLPLLPAADSEALSATFRELAYAGFAQHGESSIGIGEEDVLPKALQATARQLDSLNKENAELRALIVQEEQHQQEAEQQAQKAQQQIRTDTETRGKLAQVQKEVIKLRERNQELAHQLKISEQQLQQMQGARSGSPSRRSVMRSGSPSHRNSAPAAMAASTSGPRPGGGELHSDLRHKLKQAQQEKAKVEAELLEARQELSAHGTPLEAEVQRLQALAWEEQHQREGEQEKAQRTTQTLERRIRIMEAKLKSKAEANQLLHAEKEAVEEQLGVAAKQLEALLADESREGDLQRELASLSRQFEQLHGKHQAQLAKAADQNKQLQKEQGTRSEMEEHLREFEVEATEAKKMAQKLRKEELAQERELQAAIAEQATMTCEASQLRDHSKQQQLALTEVQEEMQRLQGQLERARERNPGAQDAVRSIKEREVKLDEAREKLRSAKEVENELRAEMQNQSAELQGMRQDCSMLHHEARAAREELRRVEDAAANAEAAAQAAIAVASAQAASSSPPWASSRPSIERRAPRSGDGDASVHVITAQDREYEWQEPDGGHSSAASMPHHHRSEQPLPPPPPPPPRHVSQSPHQQEQRMEQQQPQQHANVGHSREDPLRQALGGIKVALTPQEQELLQQKPEAWQEPPEASLGSRPVVPAAGAARAGPSSSSAVPADGAPDLEDIERDFSEFARSIGFEGDIGPLWAEAQAQAAALKERQQQGPEAQPAQPHPARQPQGAFDVSQPSKPRVAPVAADVELRKPMPVEIFSGGYPISPPKPSAAESPADIHGVHLHSCEAGGASGASAYPASPGYPSSPGRRDGDGWLSSLGAAGGAARGVPPGSETGPGLPHDSGPSEGGAELPPSPSAGLPASAREAFRHAESLCEQQRFAEAVPLFQQVLQVLSNRDLQVPPPVTAEVWAHLGVAMQSLDRVPEAIDSYRHAVALDPSLHVCFANLATLHAYLHERDRALEYIAEALVLDPANSTYSQIRQHLRDAPSSPPGGSGKPASDGGGSIGGGGDGSAASLADGAAAAGSAAASAGADAAAAA